VDTKIYKRLSKCNNENKIILKISIIIKKDPTKFPNQINYTKSIKYNWADLCHTWLHIKHFE